MKQYDFRQPVEWFSEYSGQWVRGRFFSHIPENDRFFNNEEPLCMIKYNRNLEVVLPYDKVRPKDK
tara:strand:- start:3593 stop:3790 length:198 start_codon:yes stop_codon:yes gene_type:complete